MSDNSIDQKGQCLCGKVAFHVKGDVIFNAICHCKACTRARSAPFVHVIGIKEDSVVITKGKEAMKTCDGLGKMKNAICNECGSLIYQYPEGAGFVAVPATNFQLEDGVSCKLPEKYLPKVHMNYENRQWDHFDKLPKFTTFPSSPMMDDTGNPIEA